MRSPLLKCLILIVLMFSTCGIAAASTAGGVAIKLIDSTGDPLSGGAVQVYRSGWRSLGTTNASGEVIATLAPGSYTFRMTYGSASIEKTQNISDGSPVVFQTAAVHVELRDSNGNLGTLPTEGSVRYYASGWRTFGDTSGGVATLELLPKSYSFRMTYGSASLEKAQDISDGSPVVFQTVAVRVELRDSSGNLGTLPTEGSVRYYASGWRTFGDTSGGVAVMELLPKSYSFRMTYGSVSLEKAQDISDGSPVVFQTVAVRVELRDSNGNLGTLPSEGTVRYYASGWRTFGDTSGGGAILELLPKSYSFRMTYGSASLEKAQDISDGSSVVFQTVAVRVELRDSAGNLGALPTEGSVRYYASGWRTFGDTSGGVAILELLPKSYSFRMTYGSASLEKAQDISDGSPVVFQTVAVRVEVYEIDGEAVPADGVAVRYYASGWRTLGTTTARAAVKELLPKGYTFRASYQNHSDEKAQNVASDPVVIFGSVVISPPVDLEPPTVAIQAPVNGGLYGGGVPAPAFTASDAQGAVVVVETGYSTDEGVHTYTVTATDGAGNSASASVTYTVDVTAPTLSPLGSPTCYQVLPDLNALFTLVDNLDPNPLVSLSLNVNGCVHALTVTGEDWVGNRATIEIVFKVDAEAPVVQISGIVDGGCYTSVNLPQPGWDVQDGCDPLPTVIPSGFSTDEGHHIMTVEAVDCAGNRAVATVRYTIDDTPPEVAIESPDEGQPLAGDVQITGYHRDDNLADVALLIDGQLVATGLDYTWDTTRVADGLHRVTLQATDCAGNQSVAERLLTVDNSAPMPPVVLAAASAGLSGVPGDPRLAEIELSGLAEDDAQLQVWAQAPGESEFAFVDATPADGCGHWSYSYSYSSLGEHLFKIGAHDVAGNWIWSEVFSLDLRGGQIETLVLQQGIEGYEGAVDTWFDVWPIDQQHDQDTSLRIRPGAERGGMVQFDLSAIPAGSEVLMANLGLYVTEQSNPQPLALDLYALNQGWNATDTGDGPAAGLDPAANGLLRGADQWASMSVTSLAQDWVDDPNSNEGLLIAGRQTGSVEYALASSEYPQECRRPLMAVIYSLDAGLGYVPDEPTHTAFLPLTLMGQ